MAVDSDTKSGLRTLLAITTFIVLVAAMKAAQAILIPVMLAVIFAFICLRPLNWMCSKGVPNALAVLLIVLAAMAAVVLLGVLVGSSINDFTDQIPVYRDRINAKLTDLAPRIGSSDKTIADLMSHFDPGLAMGLVSGMLTRLQGVLANSFLILFTMIFILLEAATFPAKLRRVMRDSRRTLDHLTRFSDTLNRYLAIKTMTSLGTGVAATVLVAIVGVDFPLLWGLLAFLLNYVPNIGSILAAIPAVLLALLESGVFWALITAAGYVAINVLIGTILEPRIMGRGLGLSTLVVFLSLVFWGWVLGPVGMLLSVPLTMTIKIALESSERTRRAAILLGPSPVEAEEPAAAGGPAAP